jgi:hypothetical protein
MSSETMRAVLVKNNKGPADNLYLGEAPRPLPTAGQVLVKVVTFGLNRMDISQREGHYPVPAGASQILGVEFAGIVEELGHAPADDDQSDEAKVLKDALKRWKKGDEVYGLAYGVRRSSILFYLRAQPYSVVFQTGRIRRVHRLSSQSSHIKADALIFCNSFLGNGRGHDSHLTITQVEASSIPENWLTGRVLVVFFFLM